MGIDAQGMCGRIVFRSGCLDMVNQRTLGWNDWSAGDVGHRHRWRNRAIVLQGGAKYFLVRHRRGLVFYHLHAGHARRSRSFISRGRWLQTRQPHYCSWRCVRRPRRHPGLASDRRSIDLTIGSRCLHGAYCLLGAGTVDVAPGRTLHFHIVFGQCCRPDWMNGLPVKVCSRSDRPIKLFVPTADMRYRNCRPVIPVQAAGQYELFNTLRIADGANRNVQCAKQRAFAFDTSVKVSCHRGV